MPCLLRVEGNCTITSKLGKDKKKTSQKASHARHLLLFLGRQGFALQIINLDIPFEQNGAEHKIQLFVFLKDQIILWTRNEFKKLYLFGPLYCRLIVGTSVLKTTEYFHQKHYSLRIKSKMTERLYLSAVWLKTFQSSIFVW